MRESTILNRKKSVFLIELDRILGLMYEEYTTADYQSLLRFWIEHNRERKAYRPASMDRDLFHLRRYGGYKKRCIPRILAHVEWVYVKDISYTNFILGFFNRGNFDITEQSSLAGHDLHDIFVPLDLSLMHKSTHFLHAHWLK